MRNPATGYQTGGYPLFGGYGYWSARKRRGLFIHPTAASCAVTGTITSSCNETNIRSGAKTLILTLSNDTWDSDAVSNSTKANAIIAGLDSAQAEGTGWDAVVKAGLTNSDMVRTSATVITITLPAFASYNITATETITCTVPVNVTAGTGSILGSPTFTVVQDATFAAGVITGGAITRTTAAATGTAASGGGGSYTYDWKRKAGAGSYASTGVTTQNLGTQTGLTQGTKYTYKRTDSDGLAAPIDTNEVVMQTWFGVTDTNFYWSPGNTYDNAASGAMQANNLPSDAICAIWSNCGAYCKLGVTVPGGGAGNVYLELDTTNLQTLTANKCPQLLYGADELAFSTNQPAYSASTVELQVATGLASGNHTIFVCMNSINFTVDATDVRWKQYNGYPKLSVKIIGVRLDDGATTVAPTIKPKILYHFGASLGEGAAVLGGGTAINQNDATQAMPFLVAQGLNAEVGVIQFGGQGLNLLGINGATVGVDTPALWNSTDNNQSWNKYCAGVSRLVGGKFSTMPDYINIDSGYTDGASANIGAAVTSMLNAMYAATNGATWTFVFNDYIGTNGNAGALQTGTGNATNQTLTKYLAVSQLFTIATTPGRYQGEASSAHGNVRADALCAAEMVKLMEAQIAATGSGGGSPVNGPL